jgi:putative drug exporter of the RND superfamily
MFLSSDGHAARFIICHEGDPATPEGISHVDPIKNAAKEAIKGTPVEGAKIWLGGTAAVYKDMRDGSKYDLMIAGISAASLILIIMLIITRSLVAAITIVGTVLLSLGASFGLSVLVWQDIIGFELHWMVLAMSVILLLAGGIRLQPAVGFPFQRGNPRRIADRNHPLDGRHRRRRDVCGSGVRRHHGVLRVQPFDCDGAGRHHHRVGSAVRHVDRALVHDALRRRADGPLVLVADTSPHPSRQPDAASVRTPLGGAAGMPTRRAPTVSR